MRLTKKRLRALDAALCIDDVLHEKFRRLNDELSERELRFTRRKKVANVYRRNGKLLIAMQIVEVERTMDGCNLIVV